MNIPRITRAQAAEHLANSGGGYPPAVKTYLDDLWAGKKRPAEDAQEVVVSMGQRIGFSMLASAPEPDGLNRKQRRAQAAEKRGGRP